MKRILRFIGIILATIGVGAVWGAVEPLPGTPLEFSALVGMGGFLLLFLGHWVWTKAGGAPILGGD